MPAVVARIQIKPARRPHYIRKVRRRTGVSIGELAAVLRMRRSELSAIEHNQADIMLHQLHAIADYLMVTVSELLTGRKDALGHYERGMVLRAAKTAQWLIRNGTAEADRRMGENLLKDLAAIMPGARTVAPWERNWQEPSPPPLLTDKVIHCADVPEYDPAWEDTETF